MRNDILDIIYTIFHINSYRINNNINNMPEKIANKLKNFLIAKKEERQSYANMIRLSELTKKEKDEEIKKTDTEELKLLTEIYEHTIIFNS